MASRLTAEAPLVDRPGLYEMKASAYHADPCPTPSLSSSLVRKLLQQSPEHARFAHPRLNTAVQPKRSTTFDRGTATHAYLLEGEDGFVLIDAPDFRAVGAQKARDEAWRDDKVPLLRHHWDAVVMMAEAAQRQLERHQEPPRPLSGGTPELTLVWKEAGGVWCRARLDWLHDRRDVVDDYKSTAMSAEPDAWSRGSLFSMGYDIQAAFYLRGLRAIGHAAAFRFVVQENTAPFALSVIGLTPQVLDLAARKVERAISIWRGCLRSNYWPAYPTRTCYAELPPWEETRWLEREMRDGLVPTAPVSAVDDGRSLAAQLFGDEESA